jgi:raffinose/stachyose/melibiose transport system substrate-binding protein
MWSLSQFFGEELMRRCCVVRLILIGVSVLALAGCGAVTTPTPPPTSTQAPVATPVREVVLTLGSWRPEDVEQMSRILAKFHAQYPSITIKFDPTSAPDYDAALEAQLKAGTGPDVMYLRSFSISRNLFNQGFLESLSDVSGVKDYFQPAMLAPWAAEDGVVYGVPFIATSHGVYYNQDIFDQLDLKVPQTWAELLATAQKIENAGIIPFANATGDAWTVAELMFMNLAPNFLGGREGRQQYLNGERCFNDALMVSAFQALKDLAPFLPPNQEQLTYADSQQLFLQGKAAMWLDGSWDIPFFVAQQPTFRWSVFAPPPPQGQRGYVTFHLDAGLGLNAASKYKAEARTFLAWMAEPTSGALLANELPGFFPMQQGLPPLQDEHATAFLDLNEGRGTDVRFAWEKLRDGSPDAYNLIKDNAVQVINGQVTPQQAADALQAGLAKWYPPAQQCPP